jgi:hypothetical protein
VFAGPDPLVTLGGTNSGRQGDVVTVPVTIDTAEGLDSVQLRIAYDSNALTVVNVRKGNVTADFGWYLDRQTPGLIVVDMSRLDPLVAGSGSLLEIDLRIARGASGTLPIDLQSVRLNEGRLTLGVVPTNGADATDGAIVVVPPASQPSTTERGGLRGLMSRLASSLGGVFARSSAAEISLEASMAPVLPLAGVAASVREDVRSLATEAPRVDLDGAWVQFGSDASANSLQSRTGSTDWKLSFVQEGSSAVRQPNSTLKITLPVEGAAKSGGAAKS